MDFKICSDGVTYITPDIFQIVIKRYKKIILYKSFWQIFYFVQKAI